MPLSLYGIIPINQSKPMKATTNTMQLYRLRSTKLLGENVGEDLKRQPTTTSPQASGPAKKSLRRASRPRKSASCVDSGFSCYFFLCPFSTKQNDDSRKIGSVIL
jgi:hypothetical protein